eukprot:TRINITY_DN6312_c0_g1_i1.p1 TRINITY_DN6312_c0_g1~~TRINITY_DN6312_c0_g1_i1.p1  ORF type:complete len:273 (-),score=38.84 TRINITY_DN6312_c0_g1_i1:120-860(-)
MSVCPFQLLMVGGCPRSNFLYVNKDKGQYRMQFPYSENESVKVGVVVSIREDWKWTGNGKATLMVSLDGEASWSMVGSLTPQYLSHHFSLSLSGRTNVIFLITVTTQSPTPNLTSAELRFRYQEEIGRMATTRFNEVVGSKCRTMLQSVSPSPNDQGDKLVKARKLLEELKGHILDAVRRMNLEYCDLASTSWMSAPYSAVEVVISAVQDRLLDCVTSADLREERKRLNKQADGILKMLVGGPPKA